jgi:hypothetical protein
MSESRSRIVLVLVYITGTLLAVGTIFVLGAPAGNGLPSWVNTLLIAFGTPVIGCDLIQKGDVIAGSVGMVTTLLALVTVPLSLIRPSKWTMAQGLSWFGFYWLYTLCMLIIHIA